jgi:hypothetical protein
MSRAAPTVVVMNDKKSGRHAMRRPAPARTRETAPAGNVSVIVAELSSVRCRWCNDDIEHCHESLVMHDSGDAQCIDASCSVPNEAHHMVIACGDFGCRCANTGSDAATIAETA